MKKPTGSEIRQTFIDFFVEHGHTVVPSASLVPGGDATLLFTNSGMVQFKDVFLGKDKRPYKRAVDSQKCMRVAGKHNDLDDVGRDDTHHTFFEMLGNWSFGDYYKKEAIEWAWQLLTDVWGLDKARLWATCFEDEQGVIPRDDEATGFWRQQPGFVQDHVLYFGRKDNFWEMADTGPCGPNSELQYDLHPEMGPVTAETLETDRFVELWNLVFIQYNRTGPDTLEPLPARHVDTGMGFERLVAILQGVDSTYKTDLFDGAMEVLSLLSGRTRDQMYADFTPYRVIADHARSAAFLIADGVVPGNTGRNYICRMIIRRAARFGTKIGLDEPFLAKVAEAVIEEYGSFYPELEKHKAAIFEDLTREEKRFARTVESGTAYLQEMLDQLVREGKSVLDGQKAFDLYATYGLPLEISRDIAREQGLEVDEAGFRAAMDEHRTASGGGRAMGRLGGEDAEYFAGLLRDLQSTGKLGERGVEYDPYTSLSIEDEVLALIVGGQRVDSVSFGDEVEVVLPKTGFYIESGGQVSDTGTIRALAPLQLPQPPSGSSLMYPLGGREEGGEMGGWEIEVSDVRKPSAGIVVHVGEVISGQPRVGDRALAEVDITRRHDIMRNHTATHLLHAALHEVLGPHARQAGSLVAPDRLRFDFNHPEAVLGEQIERVEKIVNEAVAADMEVVPKLKSREDAIAEGAMALFGEKYGETVRTITIEAAEQQEKYSYELCGGTHLERTSDVGAFLIVSEGSAAAGVRRIEAVTGRGAYELIAKRFRLLKRAAAVLKSSLEEVPARTAALQDEIAELRRVLAGLRAQAALETFKSLLSTVERVGDVSLLAMEVQNADLETLRTLADKFRESYPTKGATVLASGTTVIAVLTEDLVKRGLKAGDLIAGIGGRGGGRPNMAQGSLSDGLKAKEALERVAQVLRESFK